MNVAENDGTCSLVQASIERAEVSRAGTGHDVTIAKLQRHGIRSSRDNSEIGELDQIPNSRWRENCEFEQSWIRDQR